MVDDVLRMRATVVSEEALANIRKIGEAIGIVPQRAGRGFQQMNTQAQTLGQTIKNIGKELSQVIPALGGFGLGAAGIGLAAGAMIRTLTDMSKKIVELKYVSKELGLSEQSIKGFTVAAQKAGIAPEAMMQGLGNFKRNTEDFKLRIGDVRQQLVALGAAPVLARINAATNELDKLKEAWDFKEALDEADPSGMKARRFFEVIGLGADKARLSWAQFMAEKARQPVISEEEKRRIEEFNGLMVDLGTQWEHLTVGLGRLALPGLIEGLGEINKTITAIEKLLALLPRLPKPGDFGARVVPGPGVGEPGGPVKVTPGGARPWWEHPFQLFQPPAPPGSPEAMPPAQPMKGGMLPDWLSSGVGALASGLAKPWVTAHDVVGGKYIAKPETEGVLTEEDVERQRMAKGQEIKDAFGMAGYGVQAWGGLRKNLVPENLPGAIGKAGDTAAAAPVAPTVQEMNAARAARRGGAGLKPISFNGLDGTPAQGAMQEFQRAIKGGVFDALVEFQSYVLAGGGAGGGFQNAALTTGGMRPSGGMPGMPGFGGAGAPGGVPGAPGGVPGTPGGPSAAPSVPGALGAPAAPGVGSPAVPGAPSGPGSVTPGTPGSTGPAGPGGAGGITAPAGTPVARQGLATVTTPSGKTFRVDARYAENFKGFLADYEKAGGVLGPNTGTLGTRGNPSGHPIGAAIDINQTARDVRKGGVTLPKEVENALAEKWGLVSGANWRKPDAGHFGIRSSQAAREALMRQGRGPSQVPGVGQPAGQPSYEGGTKATWFHTGAPYQGQPGGPVWSDPSGRAEGAPASRLPHETPGIATPGRAGLGEWHEVTLPDGRKFVYQKTDVGPGKGPQSKGIGVDINAPFAAQAYPGGPGTFPSGKGGFQVKRIGKQLPSGVQPGLQAQRAAYVPTGPQFEEGENIPRKDKDESGSGVPSEPGALQQEWWRQTDADPERYRQRGGGRHSIFTTERDREQQPSDRWYGPHDPFAKPFGLPPGSGEVPPRFNTETGAPLGEPVSYRGTDRLDRAIDAQSGGAGLNATGNVNVNVHTNGTKASTDVKSDGLFQQSTVRQHKQMQPTDRPEIGAEA